MVFLHRLITVCFAVCVALLATGQDLTEVYLNNPSVGITTYNEASRIKILPSSAKDFPLATRFQYIYLSDVLNECCIDSRGMINKKEIAQSVKVYFDKHLDFTRQQRYNLRVFPEYNGTEPCKNAKIINNSLTDDGKMLINYPAYLYCRLSKQKNPPRIIKAVFPENFKQTKNIALLDMRNKLVQQLYDAVLEGFAAYLDEAVVAPRLTSATNAATICHKGDFVSRIEVGFVGPWGEGMTKYQHGTFDVYSFIKIAEMYKKHLYKYSLCVPSLGMRMTTTTDKSLYAFEYYLLTTTYGTLQKKNGLLTGNKEFGLFIDHIGSNDSNNDFTMSYAGKDFLPIALQKYKKTPVIGENSGRFAEENVMRDIKRFGISLCNAWTSVRLSDISDFSMKEWRQAALCIGYRFYLSRCKALVKNGKADVSFMMGNSGYTPLYDDFWIPQVVVRNGLGRELKVVDLSSRLQMKTIPCKKDEFWYQIMINMEVNLDKVAGGCHLFFRVIDRYHINENMFLDNVGRTANGEYELKE